MAPQPGFDPHDNWVHQEMRPIVDRVVRSVMDAFYRGL